MMTTIIPKLSMRDKTITSNYYNSKLGFKNIGIQDFENYLIIERDNLQIHFLNLKLLTRKKIMDKYTYELIMLMNCIAHC